MSVVKGTHSLVMGVGQSADSLDDYRTLADHAVPAVSGAWGTDWSRHVVVLVPGTLDGMAGLLGSPAASYRGIAAVTTGEAGGSGSAPADRIIVNPEAYAMLGAVGKQVVLTHETTHVATRAHTTSATPSGSRRATPTGSATRAPAALPPRPPPNSTAPSRTATSPPPSPPTRTSASAATRRSSPRRTRAAGWPAG